MTDSKIAWFEDFLGLGYHVYDIRPTIYLIFDGRRKLADTWNKIIKYWPDDEIKIRFFEGDDNYEFILYCQSRILQATNVFLKSLKISDHYRQFMDEYNGSASLQLAIYFSKEKKYELEIFKFKKKVTDVKFLKTHDADDDFIVSQARKKLRPKENS
jgi:endo-beta-N-acetylglucosaminidase D